MLQLNPKDEVFLFTESADSPQHVGGIQILRKPKGARTDHVWRLYHRWRDVPVRIEPFNYRLAETVREGLQNLYRLNLPGATRVVDALGKVHFWETLPEVNVSEHLHLHVLPRPGSKAQLTALVSQLHVGVLDRSRPLWEIHLIDGLSNGRFAIYGKQHHALADGARSQAIFQLSVSSDPRQRDLPPIWGIDPEALKRAIAKPVARLSNEEQNAESLESWGETLRQLGAVWLRNRRRQPENGMIAPFSAPASILNRPLTSGRSIGMCSLPIRSIKAVGRSAGATVNEVLLACSGGALRRYLKERNALPKQPLIATVPFAAARSEISEANALGELMVSLATNHAGSWQRLKAVIASSQKAKSHMRATHPDIFERYMTISNVPNVLLSNTKFAHRLVNTNLVVSNVPGPPEPMYMNGALIEATYSMSLLRQGQALNITATNSGPNLDVGLAACPDLVDHVEHLAQYLAEELKALEDIANSRIRGTIEKSRQAKRVRS